MSEKAIMRVKIDGRWVEVPLLVGSDGKPVQRSVVTVAKQGAEFASVAQAVEYAKTICSQDKRVLVLILDAAGFGAVIRHNSTYPNAPLYTTGRGTFSGLVFENYNQDTGSDPSYAMHFDYNNSPASGETRFIDCRFVAARSYGAGIGLGPDVELQFDSCYFRSCICTIAPSRPMARWHGSTIASSSVLKAAARSAARSLRTPCPLTRA